MGSYTARIYPLSSCVKQNNIGLWERHMTTSTAATLYKICLPYPDSCAKDPKISSDFAATPIERKQTLASVVGDTTGLSTVKWIGPSSRALTIKSITLYLVNNMILYTQYASEAVDLATFPCEGIRVIYTPCSGCSSSTSSMTIPRLLLLITQKLT